jgi:sugar lactone lactonase YvrE
VEFKLIHDANVLLAETPVWDKRSACFYWTDLFEGEIHEYNPASKEDRKWSTGKWIGSAIPTSDPAKIFAALEGGMYLLDKETGKLSLIADPEPDNPQNRYNDARIDVRGRIFTSSVPKTYATPDYTPDQRGVFYMIEKDGKITKIVDNINQYNGIVWTADNKKMYVADTYNATLLEWDYDPDTGPVGEHRVVLDFKGKQETPDGLSIDVEGNLYICHWSGKISVWDKNLNLKEDIAFPVEQVCCGGFGGGDMKDFYVATARYGFTPEQLADRGGAGGIFAARSPIAGRPDHFYPC